MPERIPLKGCQYISFLRYSSFTALAQCAESCAVTQWAPAKTDRGTEGTEGISPAQVGEGPLHWPLVECFATFSVKRAKLLLGGHSTDSGSPCKKLPSNARPLPSTHAIEAANADGESVSAKGKDLAIRALPLLRKEDLESP